MNSYKEILKAEALRNPELFWDIPKEEISNLSDTAILERFLSYGDLDLFTLVVEDRSSFTKLYHQLKNKKRSNLSPLVVNYIDLFLKNNA